MWPLKIEAFAAGYSRGSSETLLDQDLKILCDGWGFQELLDRLRTHVGRLDVTPEELEGRNQRSALFKTMFLAFQAADARDWHSNLVIALSHVGNAHQLQFHHIFPKADVGNAHQLQFHHIFPKAVLKTTATTRETDDIANLAFISGKANRKISAKEPALYFPEVQKANGDQPFESQCIPTAPDLLTVDRYKEFLAERRRLIAERLNAYLASF